MRITTTILGFTILAYALVADAAAQGVRKPVPLPGSDPGGVMVAFIGPGIDYTRAGLANRLARDGEGEIIGFDLVDRDRRPFCRVGCEAQTDAVLALLSAAPSSRLAVFKVDGSGLAAPALQMAVTAKADIIVLDLPDDPQAAALLRAASERFRDTLIVFAPRTMPAPASAGTTPSGPAPAVPAPAVPATSPEPVTPAAGAAPPAPTPATPQGNDTTGTAPPSPAPPSPSTGAPPSVEQATGPTASPAPLPVAPPSSPATDGAIAPPPVATAPPPANGRNDSVLTARDGSVKPAETPLLAAARLAAEAAKIVADSPSTRGAALKARVEGAP